MITSPGTVGFVPCVAASAKTEGHVPVLVLGAGPAGLVLGCLLQAAGIATVVMERRSREHCVTRARAGFLAANSVRVLDENGLAAGLYRNGRSHSTCEFRGDGVRFELRYDELGSGEVHTVYPQQSLVRDLIDEYIDRGGDLRFETEVLAVEEVTGDRPAVVCRDAGGKLERWRCRFVAGCDGQHGVARTSMPPAGVRRYQRDHGISWLAVLAQAPQSMAAVVYAIHDRGFAGHMARSASVTRYYLQVGASEDPQDWPDRRIWDELHERMRASEYGPLQEGPIIERARVDMSSTVLTPIQHGRLFLVGDAASLISPSAAKGANLALLEAEILARALVAAVRDGDETALGRYSDDCLPRIWRAQEFSLSMINLLHGPVGNGDDPTFLRELQHARLQSLSSSRAHQDYFAENYVGI